MTPLQLDSVQRLLGRYLLCGVPGAGPRFALTFDDGPSPRNTPRLLEALARHQARVTFFVLARRARRHAALLRRMVAEGHEIGIHGDVHLPAWTLPSSWLERDIAPAVKAILEVAGLRPRHYRAPFGLLLPAQARRIRARGLVPVLGDNYPRDHAARRSEVIAERVLSRLRPGTIVILHDSSALGDPDRRATIDAVEAILVAARERGLAAATVADLSAASRGAPPP